MKNPSFFGQYLFNHDQFSFHQRFMSGIIISTIFVAIPLTLFFHHSVISAVLCVRSGIELRHVSHLTYYYGLFKKIQAIN